jgi:predicted DNA-binding ribbon-helix-helix protein
MLKKHSITLMGHKTSISIEQEFWLELKNIAEQENKSVNEIITSIDISKKSSNLSSAIRIFVLNYLKNN